MKKNTANSRKTGSATPPKESDGPGPKIHPVVIYPFRQPADYSDLEELYRLVARLDAETDKYARPITVVDRKTYYAMESSKHFLDFRNHTVAQTFGHRGCLVRGHLPNVVFRAGHGL